MLSCLRGMAKMMNKTEMSAARVHGIAQYIFAQIDRNNDGQLTKEEVRVLNLVDQLFVLSLMHRSSTSSKYIVSLSSLTPARVCTFSYSFYHSVGPRRKLRATLSE